MPSLCVTNYELLNSVMRYQRVNLTINRFRHVSLRALHTTSSYFQNKKNLPNYVDSPLGVPDSSQIVKRNCYITFGFWELKNVTLGFDHGEESC